ncbi:MAG: alpha/beta hydrolase [bacterium]|nr:alpha/beta hydrolase [Gammaproteobacteria bacterium]
MAIVAGNVKDERIRTELVSANGLTFEVDKCGSGDKLAICLHGFPEHSFSWRYQLPMLADLGYEAWAPNMRGYGKSSRPPLVDDYSLDKLVADVGGLIDASGHKQVVLIAHDWGAVVAWQFAIMKTRPLSHLIICNVPHPGAMREAMRNGFAQLRKSWYVFFFQIPWLPEYLFGRKQARAIGEIFLNTSANKEMFPPEVREVYRNNANQPGALTAMINYYRSLIRSGRKFARQPLPIIETPTLMIWGEDDVALTKESTYGTDKYVADFSIRYLPRVSHWVQQEAPEAVNAMIQAFLKGEEVPEVEWKMHLV